MGAVIDVIDEGHWQRSHPGGTLTCRHCSTPWPCQVLLDARVADAQARRDARHAA